MNDSDFVHVTGQCQREGCPGTLHILFDRLTNGQMYYFAYCDTHDTDERGNVLTVPDVNPVNEEGRKL